MGDEMQIEANRDCVAVTGSAEEIIDCLFGPRQHDEHCKGWRWHLYMQGAKRGMDGVWAALREMREEREARAEFLRLEVQALEAAE